MKDVTLLLMHKENDKEKRTMVKFTIQFLPELNYS